MVIYNVCVKCGGSMKCRTPNDRHLKKMLSESDISVCNDCDPKSSWKIIKGTKGVI